MEEARHCKARSATLARSSSEKLGAVLQRDIIIVINVLTQRGLIVLVSRFISPSRWIVKSLTKRDIYIKKKIQENEILSRADSSSNSSLDSTSNE